MGLLTDISGRTAGIVIGICVLLGGGYWLYLNRDKTMPDIVLKNVDGESVDIKALSEGKEHTVMVFLLSGCSISKFSVGVVNDQYDKWQGKAAFVGLMLGSRGDADQYAEAEDVRFPVYGLRDATDPFAVNELIEAVGSPYGMRSAVYGGTVIVVDSDHDIVLNLAKEDIRKLPDELTDLLD